MTGYPLVDSLHFPRLFSHADCRYAWEGWKGGFRKWQKSFRRDLEKKLGLTGIKEELSNFKPSATRIDCEDLGTFTRERWEILTEPDILLPIVVLRPKDLSGKVPLMITPHGHSGNTELYAGVYWNEEDRESAEEGERNIAVQAVGEGFIAIAAVIFGKFTPQGAFLGCLLFGLAELEAFSSPADMPVCDVVIVGLKTTNERLLPTLLPPLLGPDTLVLLIQNGIGLEEDVQRMFPTVSIAAGLAFICSAKTKPGVVDHFDQGSINIAGYGHCDMDRLRAVVADFRKAGVEAHETPYGEARWKKAVWNMPFNGLTVLLEARTDELLADDASAALVRDLMYEVTDAAAACGVETVGRAFADKMISYTRSMVPYAPSMKVDYDLRRPMEIHYLYTRPIAVAREAGYEMKRMEMLRDALIFKQRRSLGLSAPAGKA